MCDILDLALVVQGWSSHCVLYFRISPVQLLILSELDRIFLQHLLILFATTNLCVDAHALACEPHLAVHPVLLAEVNLCHDLPQLVLLNILLKFLCVATRWLRTTYTQQVELNRFASNLRRSTSAP